MTLLKNARNFVTPSGERTEVADSTLFVMASTVWDSLIALRVCGRGIFVDMNANRSVTVWRELKEAA